MSCRKVRGLTSCKKMLCARRRRFWTLLISSVTFSFFFFLLLSTLSSSFSHTGNLPEVDSELQLSVLPNEHDPDSDSDGLSDSEEDMLGTDPNDVDSDDDQISDYYEVALYQTNPLLDDSDNDTLSDPDELFDFGSDPLSKDTDSDGLPDSFEAIYGLDINFNDSLGDLDGDGISNIVEFERGTKVNDSTDPDDDGLVTQAILEDNSVLVFSLAGAFVSFFLLYPVVYYIVVRLFSPLKKS